MYVRIDLTCLIVKMAYYQTRRNIPISEPRLRYFLRLAVIVKLKRREEIGQTDGGGGRSTGRGVRLDLTEQNTS